MSPSKHGPLVLLGAGGAENNRDRRSKVYMVTRCVCFQVPPSDNSITAQWTRKLSDSDPVHVKKMDNLF